MRIGDVVGLVTILVLHFGGYSQCTFTTAPPYYEPFTSLPANDQLPTCWSASSPGINCRTFTATTNANTGAQCAAFFHSPSGTHSFFSHGLLLHASVVYSASLYYKVDNSSGGNWSNLSIGVAPNQNSINVSMIASTSSLSNLNYQPLSGTFTVNNTGLYFLRIGATGISGPAEYIFFDDVKLTIPCSGPGAANVPTISLQVNNGFSTTANNGSICAGIQNTFVASGAHTYTWAGGSQTPTFVSTIVSATSTTSTFVMGTNTITGCTASAGFSSVYPVPNMTVFSAINSVCPGETTTLSVSGAHTYSWNTGASSNSIVVSPSVTTTYTATGTFTTTGCSNQAVFQLSVGMPSLTVSPSAATVCSGSSVALLGSGTYSYQWYTPALSGTSNSIIVTPIASTGYTVIGINKPNCADTAVVNVVVSPAPVLSVISGPTVLCSGNSTTLNAAGAQSYIWYGSGVTSAGASATISPASTGQYTLAGTGANGCASNTVFSIAVNECLEANHEDLSEPIIRLFDDRIEVVCNKQSFNCLLRIMGLDGRMLLSMPACTVITVVPIEGLAEGIYIISVAGNAKHRNIKFVKL